MTTVIFNEVEALFNWHDKILQLLYSTLKYYLYGQYR